MPYTWLSPRPAQPGEGRKGGLMDLLPKSELEGVEIQMMNLQGPAATREMGTTVTFSVVYDYLFLSCHMIPFLII